MSSGIGPASSRPTRRVEPARRDQRGKNERRFRDHLDDLAEEGEDPEQATEEPRPQAPSPDDETEGRHIDIRT